MSGVRGGNVSRHPGADVSTVNSQRRRRRRGGVKEEEVLHGGGGDGGLLEDDAGYLQSLQLLRKSAERLCEVTV